MKNLVDKLTETCLLAVMGDERKRVDALAEAINALEMAKSLVQIELDEAKAQDRIRDLYESDIDFAMRWR